MSRRATIKRAKIRRDDDLSRFCLSYGITKRQARRDRKWLEAQLNASLLGLLSETGPIAYNGPGRNQIVDRLLLTLAPTVTVEVVEKDRATCSMKLNVLCVPAISPSARMLRDAEIEEIFTPSAEETAAAEAFFADANKSESAITDDLRAHLIAEDRIRQGDVR